MPQYQVPGPPSSVLAAILAGGQVAQPGAQATFSTTNPPLLPSLMTEVVWLPTFAQLQADVEILGTLISQGWATGNVTAVTANYTALPTDAVILANATSGAITVTLPDATQSGFFTGQRYTVIKTDSSGHAVTVAGSAGQTINGSATQTLSVQYATTGVVFDGANWWVWNGTGAGVVTSLTAADTSVVVGGTGAAPTVRTNTLDVIAADHPAAADWSNNSHKITSLGTATTSGDALPYGQAATGDLSGTYPGPTVASTHWATQSVSGTATLGASSAPVVLTDTTSAAFTLTLPASPTTGSLFILVDDTGQWNTHNLTVGRNGKQIDGAASNLTLTNRWGKVTLYYDGTAWWSVANGLSNETPVATGTTAVVGVRNSPSRSDHGHAQDYVGLFGDGSDASVTLDGSTTYSNFSALSASTYTLTRDVFTTSLTVNPTVILAPAGFRVFCQGTVTVAGTVSAAGNAGAAAGTAGGNTGSGSLDPGQPGGAGSTTTGAGGSAGNIGAGNGGTGGTGTGGNTGGAGGTSTSVVPFLRVPYPVLAGQQRLNGATRGIAAGSGGGGGGGDGANKGGGGGSGGGNIAILAWALVNNGVLTAAGGNGGTPVTGNCGGGGPGGGGTIVTYTLAAPTGTGTTNVAAGTPGGGSGTGSAAGSGVAGNVLNVVLA